MPRLRKYNPKPTRLLTPRRIPTRQVDPLPHQLPCDIVRDVRRAVHLIRKQPPASIPDIEHLGVLPPPRQAEIYPQENAGIGGLEGDAVAPQEGGGEGVVLRQAALALRDEEADEALVLEDGAGHEV